MEKTEQWRDLDRPEASLIGVQYRGNDRGGHRGAWIVRDAGAARWLFAGTGLHDGSSFGGGGIEIDETSPDSPEPVHVLAEIPNIFGPGFTAQMTYYETRAGAKVFAAGAFSFASAVPTNPVVHSLMDNLWRQLARP
jgi:N,N-dimethylformamidase beta subunit-like, C-terminal